MSQQNQNTFTELDFDAIKGQFIEFLKAQNQYADFNFEGANISILMDLLAHNQQQHGFYSNALMAESSLSTAQRRIGVVEHAKDIGYTPQSARSATALLNITFESDSDEAAILPIRSTFLASADDGTSYKFVNRERIVAPVALVGTVDNGVDPAYNVYGGSFDVEIHEGVYKEYSKVISGGANGVIIPNKNVDTKSLRVFVSETDSPSSVETEFKPSTSWTEDQGTSPVYYLEEVDGERFRVYFGRGVVGAPVFDGYNIRIEYQISSLDGANGAKRFTLPSGAFISADPEIADPVVVVLDAAAGGSPIETITSIKLAAPVSYQSQNRGVLPLDYKQIIKSELAYVDDVVAWGGEDNDPPIYGKVFISTKQSSDSSPFMSDNLKATIEKFLTKNYSVMTIEPEIIDPVFMNVVVETEVLFDSSQSASSFNDIKTAALDAIKAHSAERLEKFDSLFRYSRLVAAIDNSSPDVLSNSTSVKLSQRIENSTLFLKEQKIRFANPIVAGTLRSNYVTYQGIANAFFIDDGIGNLVGQHIVNGRETPIKQADGSLFVFGTVDYSTGELFFDLSILKFDDIAVNFGDGLEFTIQPDVLDLLTYFNQVISIDTSDVTIVVRDAATGIQQ